MKIAALLIGLLFCVQAMCANSCRLPYRLGYSEKGWSHFYSKTEASNIWVKDFSSEKFIKTFKGKVDFYDYVKTLTRSHDYSDTLDQNIKSLAYKLFDKNMISQNQYKGILQGLSHHSERKKMIKMALKELKTPKETASKIEIHLQNSKLNKGQLELMGKKLLSQQEEILKSKSLLDYIDFLNTRKSTELTSYIEKIDDLFTARSKQVRQFNRNIEKVEHYKNKISKAMEKRFLKENKGEELNLSQKKRLEREIAEKTRSYSKTLRSCGNREFLSTHAKSSEKKFTRFLLGFSTLTTAGGFTLANYQDPIDQEWVKKLGYEVVFGAFFAWLGAKVSINPHFSFMKKTAVNMGVSAGFDIFDSFLYDTLISEEENKAENLSAEKKKAIKELTKEFEKRELDKKFLTSYRNYFYVDQEEKDSQLIYASELEKEERSDEIIESISSSIQEGKMVDWLSENAGVQRFTFHRAWDLISIPKTVALGVAMYQVFCMSKINPAKAYRIAASMIIADEVFESFLYYKVRKSTINQ